MPADSTQVMTCAEAAGGVGASVVLLNPDLGMKVALGIHQKECIAIGRSCLHGHNFFGHQLCGIGVLVSVAKIRVGDDSKRALVFVNDDDHVVGAFEYESLNVS